MVKPKVFIISYACNPDRQSELAIGWNFIKYLSRYFELSVLTREKNKTSIINHIEKLKDNDLKKINWYFYDLPNNILGIKQYIGTQLYYKFWLLFSYKKYNKTLKEEKFDLVNHLNYGIVWMSSPYYRISKNFVWGPIGGGDLIPFKFLREQRTVNIIRELIYGSLIWYSRNISINNKLCRKNSKAILFRTSKVANNYLKGNDITNSKVICETGFDSDKIIPVEKNFLRINAIVISRMDYWKGIIYAVKGFENFIKSGGEGIMTILGDGTEFKRIENYILKQKLNKYIHIKGKVNYSEYLKYVSLSNVLIYPSFRDGGSFTVLESMALGIPVICSNNSGPADMVGDDAGFIIDLTTPEKFSNDICDKLHYLEKHPDIWLEKSLNARERALEFYTWNKRGEDLRSVFEDLLFNNSK